MRATNVLLSIVLVVAGCDLIGEPAGPMVVTITGPESAVGERTTNEEDEAIVECRVQLRAAAAGGGNWSTATWTGAMVEWTDLETGELQQGETWDGQTVAGLWQTPRLHSNQSRTSTWSFWSFAPFQLDATFLYYDSQTEVERSTDYSLTCE